MIIKLSDSLINGWTFGDIALCVFDDKWSWMYGYKLVYALFMIVYFLRNKAYCVFGYKLCFVNVKR